MSSSAAECCGGHARRVKERRMEWCPEVPGSCCQCPLCIVRQMRRLSSGGSRLACRAPPEAASMMCSAVGRA